MQWDTKAWFCVLWLRLTLTLDFMFKEYPPFKQALTEVSVYSSYYTTQKLPFHCHTNIGGPFILSAMVNLVNWMALESPWKHISGYNQRLNFSFVPTSWSQINIQKLILVTECSAYSSRLLLTSSCNLN